MLFRAAQLSTEEQVNYDVFRPEIEDSIADQKFRDYEMPANSDSAFWTDFGYTARRPFKNAHGLQELDRADARYSALFPRRDREYAGGAGARLHAAAG